MKNAKIRLMNLILKNDDIIEDFYEVKDKSKPQMMIYNISFKNYDDCFVDEYDISEFIDVLAENELYTLISHSDLRKYIEKANDINQETIDICFEIYEKRFGFYENREEDLFLIHDHSGVFDDIEIKNEENALFIWELMNNCDFHELFTAYANIKEGFYEK